MRKLMFGTLIFTLFLAGCGSFREPKGNETAVSRALGVKGICVILFGDEAADTSDLREDFSLPYDDVSEEDWYYPYAAKMFEEGQLLPSRSFEGEKALTLEECASLISRVNAGYAEKIKVTEENKNSPVSLSAWTKLLSEAAQTELTAVKVFGFSDFLYSDKGKLSARGMDFSPYGDKEVSILAKDGEVLGLEKVISDEARFENVYISGIQGGVLLNFQGFEREFPYDGNPGSSVGNVVIKDGKIREIAFLKDAVSGAVRKVSDKIEIDGKSFEISDETVFFLSDEGIKNITKREVFCGDKAAVFYSGGAANAVIVTEKASPEFLRIALKTTDYEDYYHEKIVVEGDGVVRNGDKETEISGRTDLSGFFGDGTRIYIEPEGESLKIPFIERAGGNPAYRGRLEAEKTDEGYIIINEIPMEDYLRGVVPSEISADFGLAAAEAQALCARSYAFNAFYENKFAYLGGNLDDSSASQVYNNYPENEVTDQAVKNTEGKCIVYENTVISANFYSTSCGAGANSGEVWLSGETLPYLAYRKFYSGDYGDLSKEAKARVFLEAKDVVCPETGCPWFRWETEIPVQALEEKFPAEAEKLYAENPAYISAENGFDPGTIESVYVTERGQGGNIISICAEGSLCTVRINGQYAIRRIFAPCSEAERVILTDNSGAVYRNYPMLPSGFFVFDEVFDGEDRLTALKIHGGGFGHGVGMSQNGAGKLAEKGFSGEEIVKFFYPRTEVVKIFGENFQ